MYTASFEYLEPSSLEHAVEYLQSYADEDVKLLAGGQSLVPMMRLRFARPTHLVDLNRVPSLDRLFVEDGSLRIGALVRESALESAPVIRERFHILYETTRVIADPSVRNLATVGGNLAHGDPANDHPATMIALDASVVATGPGGQRTIPVSELFLGLFETALAPSEILTEIKVPVAAAGTGFAYRKLKRQVGDFAIVGVAARLGVEDGVVSDARLVFTNVGSTPVRSEAVERELVGRPAEEDVFRSAAAAAAEGLELTDDSRGSAPYRRRVANAWTFRALAAACRRARDGET